MVKNGLEFWASKDIRRRAVDLVVFHHTHNGKTGVVTALTMETIEPDQAVAKPSMTLTLDEAVGLMDELWDAGVRPSGVGSTGELAALRAHLEDMRTLVFKGKQA